MLGDEIHHKSKVVTGLGGVTCVTFRKIALSEF